MLALMLALAWVPLMSHCQIESSSGFAFLRCAPETHPSANVPGHCAGSSCCAVESGKYQAPSNQQIVPAFAFALLAFGIVADPEPSLLPQVSLSFLTAAPPDLSTTWQFTFRTAPLSRAPSLIS
jgi:hypothetical protein